MIFKIILATFIFTSTLFAHPHTFINVYSAVKSKGQTIKSIHFNWELDEMTSSMLIMEFDQNLNGRIDKNELDYIKQNYFNSLSDFNFYTDIKIADKMIRTEPEYFKANIKDNKIYYSFDVKIEALKNDIAIEFYDKDRFVAMIVKDEYIKSDIEYKILEVDNDFYFAYRLEFK